MTRNNNSSVKNVRLQCRELLTGLIVILIVFFLTSLTLSEDHFVELENSSHHQSLQHKVLA